MRAKQIKYELKYLRVHDAEPLYSLMFFSVVEFIIVFLCVTKYVYKALNLHLPLELKTL